MASFYNSIDAWLARLGRTRHFNARNFQMVCASCGIFCALFFLFAFVAADFLPPIRPYWSAEQTAHHYKTHQTGVHTGSALLLISGMFYLPYTTVISAQMQRIPNLPYVVSALQLASGAAGVFTFVLPGVFMGVAGYRVDRPVEITQSLNDQFWITALMPWPTFMAQNFAMAYAILTDTRPRPIFPRIMAVLNVVVPVLFVPATAIHTAFRGPLSWRGALTFWIPGMTFVVQLIIDSLCLFRAILIEDEDNRPVDVKLESGTPQNGEV